MTKKKSEKSPENTTRKRSAIEERPLKAKEIIFVENYISNGEKGGPAILETEGYNVNGIVAASVQANRLLKKAKVQELIRCRRAELQKKIEENTEITRAHLVQDLQNVKAAASEDRAHTAVVRAIDSQAKLLGYDKPAQGDKGGAEYNIIVFGQPDQRKQIESRVVDNQ